MEHRRSHESLAQVEGARSVRELHDAILQDIGCIRYLLSAAAERIPPESEGARHVLSADAIAEKALDDARRFVRTRTPPLLGDSSVEGALRRLDEQQCERADLRVAFCAEGTDGLRPCEQAAVLRVVQGLMADVVQNASAEQADVTIVCRKDGIAIRMTDDGIGVDGTTPERAVRIRDTFGLQGVRGYVEEIGGTMDIHFAGEGRIVAIDLPRDGSAPDSGVAKSITVMIADDHPTVRVGVRVALEAGGIRVVAEAATPLEAEGLAREFRPDVVLLDLDFGDVSGRSAGIAAARRLRTLDPAPIVLILSGYGTPVDVMRADEAGAAGFVLKGAAPDELISATQSVAAGGYWVSPQLQQFLWGRHAPADRLTEREVDVLRRVALGETNGEIARKLSLSEATVKSHLARLNARLGISTRTAAVRYARAQGYLD